MFELQRRSPLEDSGHPKSFTSHAANLSEEAFLGQAKFVLRSVTAQHLERFADLAGCDWPVTPNAMVTKGEIAIACVAPHEWLILGPEPRVTALSDDLQKAVPDVTALLSNISDGRSSILVEGPRAEEVLSAHIPMDFTGGAVGTGHCATTLFGETGVFVHRTASVHAFRLIFDQSYASYAWRLLEQSCTLIGQVPKVD